VRDIRVVIVNESDIQGGAARAAYRLHLSILSAGIDSLMLVQRKFSDDPTVLGPETDFKRRFGKVRPFLDLLPAKKYKDRTNVLFSTGWLPFGGIAERINQLNPDLVHLHWITGGMMRIDEIVKIKAPIVWSLHDMWPFTGGCHYDGQCGRYRESCGNCPLLLSRKENDLSREVFARKSRVYSKKRDMTIVGLSSWITRCAESSSLLSGKRVVHLPNPIDTDNFRPFDKRKARELWRFPFDRKILLYGAMSAAKDPRKGLQELNAALDFIGQDNLEVFVFGASQPFGIPSQRFKTTYLGTLHDEISIISLYNACDLMVVPSLRENLSNSIMEALSCGTPVVAFNVGGNADMIEHKKNGYLARPFEPKDLALGVEWVLDAPNYEDLRINAREKVLQEFRSDLVAERYLKIYNEILQGGK
jgi:glycosyltransferase involved in cell wall biosynthesis